MDAVSVIVPFRPDGAHRDTVWRWLRDRWAQHHPRWQVVVGEPPAGAWCKALAVRDALTRADGDILVIADADVWCDTVDHAVAHLDYHRWSIPHADVYRLTPQATTTVLAGAAFDDAAAVTQRPYRGHPGGGIVVLDRDTLEEAPIDPRFVGWGQEDDSWGLALTTVAGKPWRGRAPLWHLWHPPAERLNRMVGSEAGEQLYLRYHHARKHPQIMRELLEEARNATAAA